MQSDVLKGIPLDEKERMTVGYIVNKGQQLSELGRIYIEAVKKYHDESL